MTAEKYEGLPDGKATRDTIFNVRFGSFADSSLPAGFVGAQSLATQPRRLIARVRLGSFCDISVTPGDVRCRSSSRHSLVRFRFAIRVAQAGKLDSTLNCVPHLFSNTLAGKALISSLRDARSHDRGLGDGESDPIARMSFAFTKFLEKALDDPLWGRLVIRSAETPAAIGRIRENLKSDLAHAMAQGRLALQDVELAADLVIGIWLQVTRGSLERHTSPELTGQALDAVLRALGVTQPRICKSSSMANARRSRSSEGVN
jgi:hypothetical protein